MWVEATKSVVIVTAIRKLIQLPRRSSEFTALL